MQTLSAWPIPSVHQSGKAPSPLLVFFGWQNPLKDKVPVAAVEESAECLAAAAKAKGLFSDRPPALYEIAWMLIRLSSRFTGTTYPKSRALEAKTDPMKVMGLVGGFKF